MKIARTLLSDLLAASRNSLPDEFFAILSSTKNDDTMDEFVLVPTFTGKSSAWFSPHDFPIEPKLRGTFHSHPTPDGRASRADRESFKRTGIVHIIGYWPFGPSDWIAYDANGRPLILEVTP
jgi:proteasome lid subunit RPN8/RPN11